MKRRHLSSFFLLIGLLTFACQPCGDDPIEEVSNLYSFNIQNDSGESVFKEDYKMENFSILRVYGNQNPDPNFDADSLFSIDFSSRFSSEEEVSGFTYLLQFSPQEVDTLVFYSKGQNTSEKCKFIEFEQLEVVYNNDTLLSRVPATYNVPPFTIVKH